MKASGGEAFHRVCIDSVLCKSGTKHRKRPQILKLKIFSIIYFSSGNDKSQL